MKKILTLGLLVCTHMMYGVASQTFILLLKNKKFAVGFKEMRSMTSEHREKQKDFFEKNCPDVYAFFLLMEKKLEQTTGLLNQCVCVPPEKIEKNEDMNTWLEEQEDGWIFLEFNKIKQKKTLMERFFSESMKKYVTQCSFESYLETAIEKEKKIRDLKKKQDEESQDAFERLKSMVGEPEESCVADKNLGEMSKEELKEVLELNQTLSQVQEYVENN